MCYINLKYPLERGTVNMFANQKIWAGLLGLALTAAMAQAAEPTIDYAIKMEITFTGVLYQSTDGVNWTKVEGAVSPYYVPMDDARKMLFCSKDELDHPPTPGDDFTTSLPGGVDLGMNWINPGTFMMGSPDDELGRNIAENEQQHQVTLTQGYWIGKYPVTEAQYKSVIGSSPSSDGDDHPVHYVSWSNATNFCAKLTEIERAAGRLPKGYEYSLPTEAQWQYACRAGTTTALYTGKNLTDAYICPNVDEVAWYVGNSNNQSHPVGQKKPNAWGLYDMLGNVWEWCWDYFEPFTADPVVDPKGPATGTRHTGGGGFYGDPASRIRSGYRYVDSDYGFVFSGFRVALVAVASSVNSITVPLSDSVNLELNWIEPGTFIMGSPEDELGRYSNETQHQVTLTKGYWLGKYEVTQAQYETVMGTNPSYWKGANLPVETVSWSNAMDFCAKLTASEKAAGRLPNGYEYTLPTEAQWEYACRAGTTTALNSGKNLSDKDRCPEMNEVGWYDGNFALKTHLVGQMKPNAWGLYDMHGNVFEWCLDWYEENYPTSAVTDPTGPETGEYRVLRGGSYYDYANYCRSAYRYFYADAGWAHFGFRVALAPVK